MPRFLIVRLGALGDIVHALPVAAALRRAAPSATIDWAVEARHRMLVDWCPAVDEVVTFDSRRVLGPDGWVGLARRLRAAHYDVAFDVQGLIKSAAVARLSGAPTVVGFAREALRERAASVLYTRQARAPGRPHVIDRNLTVLGAAGMEASGSREFPLNVPAPGPAIAAFIAPRRRHYAVINPGGNWPNKRWPPDRFGELAARLRETPGIDSVVTWGPGDERLAAAVAAASSGAAIVAPPTRLADMIAVLQGAAVVVSGDTGPLHLAAVAGAPIVGIYGPTDPARNGPWRADDVVVTRHRLCRCSHRRRCHAAQWCLDSVEVDEVASAVRKRLAAAGWRQ